MEDLIKIAVNGQWILEKASKPDVQKMVEEFLRQKNAAKAAPREPPKNPLQNLRPVQHQTGNNPEWSKEQLAAFRAGIPPDVVDKAKPQSIPQQANRTSPVAKLNAEQQQDDEKAKIAQGRKAAWEAGVAFLAQHGEKGYKALQSHMEQRKALDLAHEKGSLPKPVKPNLMPPQEYSIDDNGQRVARERQGTFHNQGARTTGKVVLTNFSYPDKETGEMKFGKRPQQEEHHWRWDHNNKKWEHVKTVLVSPNR